MSIYDHKPMERLHQLFLRLDYRWLGYSSEEFEDEGLSSAIAFIPADKEGYSLMTVKQEREQDENNQYIKDKLINNAEVARSYEKAFSDFVNSLSKKQIEDIELQVNSLDIEGFEHLVKVQ